MKIKASTLVVLSALSLSSMSALALGEAAVDGAGPVAPVVLEGSKARFEGKLVEGACAISTDSLNQLVVLGDVKTSKLGAMNETSGAVGFNISLEECSIDTHHTVSIAFQGTTVGGSDNVLALQGEGSGQATNVGIQILDGKSVPLTLDGQGYTTAQEMVKGTNTIPFQARYIATGVATSGQANSEAIFYIKYE